MTASAAAQEALGIPIMDWISFLQLHSDSSGSEAVTAYSLEGLRTSAQARSEKDAQLVFANITELVRLMAPASVG